LGKGVSNTNLGKAAKLSFDTSKTGVVIFESYPGSSVDDAPSSTLGTSGRVKAADIYLRFN